MFYNSFCKKEKYVKNFTCVQYEQWYQTKLQTKFNVFIKTCLCLISNTQRAVDEKGIETARIRFAALT